ncbi:MAG: hypothetical protein AAF202_01010 [Pseudomonadota bacterium]
MTASTTFGGNNTLFEVDLATGNRTAVSSASVGSGPVHASAEQMRLNSAKTHAYVLDSDLNALILIRLTDGARTIAFDFSNRDQFFDPSLRSFVITSDESKAYIIDGSWKGIYEVDLVGDTIQPISR